MNLSYIPVENRLLKVALFDKEYLKFSDCKR